MDEEAIEVMISCTLPTLRGLHECVNKCYKTWPGGDPQEQRNLETMRAGLYVILMDALLENDLV
tara:strand:+ start:91 stop:282 length:192 start_codon:yes stop_codon:yes gene_type:complete